MTDRHPLDGDTDVRELSRRVARVEELSAHIEDRTDERHAENQASTGQLSNDFDQMRETMETQARESHERWQRVDRFMDDWEGRPLVGKVGLGIQIRGLLNDWAVTRGMAKLLWALIATVASGLGYLAAHFLESHK